MELNQNYDRGLKLGWGPKLVLGGRETQSNFFIPNFHITHANRNTGQIENRSLHAPKSTLSPVIPKIATTSVSNVTSGHRPSLRKLLNKSDENRNAIAKGRGSRAPTDLWLHHPITGIFNKWWIAPKGGITAVDVPNAGHGAAADA
ncbi:hypothetical protein EVAR_90588_1 [Eumeta japonica]|uniref:Uncharacterized protein n=1 Tax=Eumeta variegata TaxID=151549 RepID=A0A4C2A1K2_EUMVA|nr:hypothetical protein EVAR_90588_1 [Eumeta japonica]